MKKNFFFENLAALLILSTFFILTGCASTSPVNSTGLSASTHQAQNATLTRLTPPPGTALFFAPADDSLETFNHGVQTFNNNLYHYAGAPLARVWDFAVPSPVQQGLENVSATLRYPLNLTTNALQGEWGHCWDETRRFVVNATAGVFGLMDVASKHEIGNYPSDFSQVLSSYGIGNGCYLTLPVIGPSSVRDATGLILDMPFNVLSWMLPTVGSLCANGTLTFNRYSDLVITADQLFTCSYDSYLMTKAFYFIHALSTRKAPVMADESFSAPDDSLNVLNAQTTDPKFFYQADTHRVFLDDSHAMPYSCWNVENSGNLAIILPGLGGHRLCDTVLYLAERLNQQGASVISISPTLDPDYFLNLPASVPIGNFQKDSTQLASVLARIVDDYKKRYASPEDLEITILGYSLGGVNTLYLAHLDYLNQLPASLKTSRFLAINPPVNIQHALEAIDTFFNLPLSRPEGQQEAWTENIYLKLIDMVKKKKCDYPLTLDESRFLIGFNMRLAIAEAIVALEQQVPTCNLPIAVENASLNALWIAATSVPCTDYALRWVMPYYQNISNLLSDESFMDQCGNLKLLDESIRNNKKINVIHCKNDFLLTEEDIFWLQESLGNRLTLFPAGGHLGEIPTPAFNDLFIKLALTK